MEASKKPYEELSPRTLFNIWKGNEDFGEPQKAEEELKQRINREGRHNISGPCKILYLDNDNLRFTILSTKASKMAKKGIFLAPL